jgi:2-phospho-L-lactate transferase/gluconeogenesis factor (CofD/UPF0052 family)
MNVVLFSGGNGNANLIKYLKNISYINLSILINGYDDGLSTGVIRSANYGMLGPSDFRKNFTYILDDFTESNRNVRNMFEHRLSREEVNLMLISSSNLLYSLCRNVYILDKSAKSFIEKYFNLGVIQLLNFTTDENVLNGFSIGNIIIGGIFAETQDFNEALSILTRHFNLSAKLINISTEDDSKLVAFDTDNNFLINESDIVSYNGDYPLKSFYLIPLNKISTLHANSTETEVRLVSHVPRISDSARQAILTADLIIFGSGTLFSSLLPTYRICNKDILESEARKVLIVNNKFDNDIKNITLSKYLELTLQDFPTIGFDLFKSILYDCTAEISKDIDVPNLVIGDFSDNNFKHSGAKIWKSVLSNIEYDGDSLPVLVQFIGKSQEFINSHYRSEVEKLNIEKSRNIKYHIERNDEINYQYNLIINSTGKVQIEEVDEWINIIQQYQFDGVIGSRFESRKQLINSIKQSLVESNFNYYFSLISSHLVSLIYFIRFGKLVPDPLSGIYLYKNRQKSAFNYVSVSEFLKFINSSKGLQFVSLPIGYRTFKNQSLLRKIGVALLNLLKIYA